MADPRQFQKIDILIPGYSIEDIPTDLNESKAASLLNAFSVAWHPWLLSAANCVPAFKQAESTELPTGQHIVLVPSCSEDWLGHDWKEHFADTLSVVLHNCSDRTEWLAAISEHFADEWPAVDSELLSHFFALGTVHLQVSLLSRRMHHYVDPDSYLLESETLAAAKAALEGDHAAAHEHLRRCFECLQECREQFQPVNCFLVDVCLPSEQTSAEELSQLVTGSKALSLICSGKELEDYAAQFPEFQASVSTAVNEGRLSLLTGHQNELRTSLGSVSSLYSDLAEMPEWVQALAKDRPLHWARRRFGMTSGLPSILNHFQFASALHVVLDDGLYPDREYGQLSWRAADGSVIPAVSRIPVAIDGAASFLRFADRYTESMQEDSSAVMMLARLPKVQTPWLGDLQLAASHAPVLGAFVTMAEFVDQTGDHSFGTKFDEGEYLSPYLIQSSVLKTEAPISSPAELHHQRALLESCCQLDALCCVLKPKLVQPTDASTLERQLNEEESLRIELANDRADNAAEQQQRLAKLGTKISAAVSQSAANLAEMLPYQDANTNGLLVTNPLPWKRSETIAWPHELKPAATSAGVTEAWQQNKQTYLDVEIPAGGFLWLNEATANGSALVPNPSKGKPLAEHLLLRNKFFEVEVSQSTGGLTAVRFHNQRANRISQQVSFRYANSKTIKLDDEEEVQTSYALTRLVSSRVIEAGSAVGIVETTCEIVDAVDESVLARFRQTFRVTRNSTRLQLTIEFDKVAVPPTGNPWMTYFASRFAWDNESAAITRSMLGQAAGFRMERFEAPDYIEVADSDQRVLIIPHGRPYHRRSGPRMLDSLLLVEGESANRFEFCLDFDQPLPMRTAAEIAQPCTMTATKGRRPKSADSTWLLGLSAKNIVAARTRLFPAVPAGSSGDVSTARSASPRLRLLLQESEGRPAKCFVKTARPPVSARLVKANGDPVAELKVAAEGILIDFLPFQMKEVELTF